MLPPDFDGDWVTARAKCSVATMFESLKKEALRNTHTRNELVDASGDKGRFSMVDRPDGFRIGDTWSQHGRRTVDFALDGGRIDITQWTGSTPKLLARVTVTLNDEGRCRFKVHDAEREGWQILKDVLEWLFFDEPK